MRVIGRLGVDNNFHSNKEAIDERLMKMANESTNVNIYNNVFDAMQQEPIVNQTELALTKPAIGAVSEA